jgi:hypothetical protein
LQKNSEGPISPFRQEDLQQLDMPDGSFDLVWCWGVAMMAPRPELVFRKHLQGRQTRGVIYLGVLLEKHGFRRSHHF